MLDTFNIIASSIMAVLSFSTLAAIQHKDENQHIKASLIFWGATFALILVLFLLKKYAYDFVFIQNAWIATSVDSIANMSLILCAYSLYKGPSFKWNDRIIHVLYAVTPAFFIAMLVLGILIQKENIVWKLFYITPSALIASFTLMFIAISAFREPYFNSLKWPIVIVFSTYAYIQIPAYVFIFVPSTPEIESALKEGRYAITLFGAVGKGALIALFIGLLINKGSYQKQAKFVAITNTTLGVLSIGFTLLVLFYRVATAMEVTGG